MGRSRSSQTTAAAACSSRRTAAGIVASATSRTSGCDVRIPSSPICDHAGAPQEAERLDEVDVLVEHARRSVVVGVVAPDRGGLQDAPRARRQALERAAMMSASVSGTAPDSSRRKRRSCSR